MQSSEQNKVMSEVMKDLGLFAKVVSQSLLSDDDGYPLENLDVRLLLAESDSDVLDVAMERRLLLNHRLNRVVENMVYLNH